MVKAAADASALEPGRVGSSEPYEIAAIASSAGGVTALGHVLGGLPARFSVPVLVVQHLDPRHETVLAEILRRRTKMEVTLAAQGERAEAGTVYIVPPDRHLLVEADGTLTLSSSPLVHFVRPSADLLFESVAGTYGPRAIACVLTGTGSDGAMGLSAVKVAGAVIAEDPESAEFKGMPQAAVASGAVDFVLPLDEIASVIRGLVEAKRQRPGRDQPTLTAGWRSRGVSRRDGGPMKLGNYASAWITNGPGCAVAPGLSTGGYFATL